MKEEGPLLKPKIMKEEGPLLKPKIMKGTDLRKTKNNGWIPKKIKEKLVKDSGMEPPGVEHVFIHEKELYKSWSGFANN